MKKINTIKISHVKGIEEKEFTLNIVPNKPTILVASNGFGKSSLAIAFDSLKKTKINLNEDHYYKLESNYIPEIAITYECNDYSIKELKANNNINSISPKVGCFVINNKLKPKGTYGVAKAIFVIPDLEITKIPPKVSFTYKVTDYRRTYGTQKFNNIKDLLEDKKIIHKISELYDILKKLIGKRNYKKIETIIDNINNDIFDISDISEFELFNNIKNTIYKDKNDVDSVLNTIQIILLYKENEATFKRACEWSNYQFKKEKIQKTLEEFNLSWQKEQLKLKEITRKKALFLQFPEPTSISNGQRDILVFIAMLLKAEIILTKENAILIIDEVFDYLDDANLVAAQFYITKFIENFKLEKRKIFPLILTHLDPSYFRNLVFNKQQVVYLMVNNFTSKKFTDLEKLIRYRSGKKNESNEKDFIDKSLLHYDPNPNAVKIDFTKIKLPKKWEDREKFIKDMNDHINYYLANEPFNPFAVLVALRNKIEEIVNYKMIV